LDSRLPKVSPAQLLVISTAKQRSLSRICFNFSPTTLGVVIYKTAAAFKALKNFSDILFGEFFHLPQKWSWHPATVAA